MSSVIDQATRSQRRAADPMASVWVGANAGTGKTKVLTDRVLNLLLAGTAPERILCLTFTKAAAAEMSTRLADRLSGWAVMGDEDLDRELMALGVQTTAAQRDVARQLFARLLDVPGGMRIETIHAFCQGLLRRFPLEAGVSPHFDILDDRGANELMAQSYERLLVRARNEDGSVLKQALSVVTANVHEMNFPGLMAQLTGNRGRLRRLFDHHGSALQVRQALFDLLDLPLDTTPGDVLGAAVARVDRPTVTQVAQALGGGLKKDQEAAALLTRWLTLDTAGQVENWDLVRGAFLTKTGEPRSTKTFPCKAVKEGRPDILPQIDRLTEEILRLEDRLKAARVAEASSALLTLGHALIEGYTAAKDQRGMLDYDDLILTARRLLGDSGAAAWVLYKLDGGIDHVMIDEAQDTSPDQWDVVASLTQDFFSGEGARPDLVRTVFAVGDRKQSIYSFQGADPRAFDAMRRTYADKVPAAGLPFADVALDVSFRSVPAILTVVDRVFSRPPASIGVRTEGDSATHMAAREGMAGVVEVWPTIAPQAIDPGSPWKPPVEAIRGESAQTRLARLLARRIATMVHGDRLDSQDRPLRPGDIMVLVRRRTGFVEDLVRALKGEGVPVAGVDRMVLVEQMAVMDLLALGDVLILPEDSLSLACVLKGPLFGLDEDQLRGIAQGRRKGVTLWRALREAGDGSSDLARMYRTAYQMLRDLMEKADFLPPHELFAHILGPLGGRRKLLGRLGPDAADPLDEFVQLTLAYDRGHPPSLQGFLHWVRADEGQLKRDMEEGTDAVRVMTVHGSKGLQAPVVILPDTRGVPTKFDAVLWDDDNDVMLWPPRAADRDPRSAELYDERKQAAMEEYRRLLYVALTRAEDRLIVCGWDGKKSAPTDNWYDLVSSALEDLGAEVPDPFLQAEGPGVGLETAEVWRLAQAQSVPPRRTASAHDAAFAAEGEADALPGWVAEPPPAEPSPPRPLAPSRVELPDPPARSPLDTTDGGSGHADPARRFRRGTLIHRLLQSLPDLPVDRRQAAAEQFLARPVWELSDQQQMLLCAETLAVLEDETFQSLFAAGSLAEVPITGIVGGHVVSGQVDRLLVTDEEVLVVDYKTNRPPPLEVADVAPAYVTQMALYRAVLQGIYPARTVRCALLWTDGPRLMPLPPALMEQALKIQKIG